MGLREFLSKLTGVAGVNMAEKLAGLVLGVLLVRWLGTETYGLYAFVMALVSLGMIATVVGLPQWLLREVASNRDRPEDLAGRRAEKRVLVLVAASGAAWIVIGSGILMAAMTPGPLRSALLLALWLLAANALLRTMGHALRAWSQEVRAQFLTSLVPTAGAAGLVAVLYLGLGSEGTATQAIAARGVAIVAALIVAAALLLRIERPAPGAAAEPHRYGAILRGAFPFMLIGSAAIVLQRTDVIMLGFLSSFTETGIYRIGAQGAALIQLALVTANVVAVPQFARFHAAGDKVALERFAIMAARLAFVAGFVVAVVLTVFGATLLELFFGAEAIAAWPAMMILSWGFALSLAFGEPGFLLNMSGHETVTLKVMAGGAALNIVLNAIAIPLAGAEGAAAATVLSLLGQRFVMSGMVRRRIGISCRIV